nr:RNA-directed DNA polymerase, eukaryota, reverse transcriptase zinc-binding domain protein [Tanacetum cinerariifolium]
MESDEVIKSSVENIVSIPSEFEAMESDEVIKSSVENIVSIPSEFEGIPDTMCDVHLVNNPTPLEAKDHFAIVTKSKDDISSSDDDSLYNENIEYVEASPHDSELVSLEVAEIAIPEEEGIKDDNLHEKLLNETNTIENSLPEFENFYFDLEEMSSGSTTTHFDISLLDYEAFYFHDDHIKEISSVSTTTHYDISLSEYDSFIFDLSKDQFPLTDMSDFAHEEFADELAHIISPPESDFAHEEFADELAHIISPPDLLHLADSQPMLKSSYKAEDGLIISIPPLVEGVADVVVEIKGTGVKEIQEKDKIETKPDKNEKQGDKNSKFFHGIINKKRSQLSIRGVFVDGDWNTDPEMVKDVFKDQFETRFKQPAHGRLKLNISFSNRLSTDQVADMDRSVSQDEIRVAVWNYGENKSPGPDGYTFEFLGRYWRFIGSDFCSAVERDQVDDLERPISYDEIKRAVWGCGTNKSPGPDGFTFDFFRRYWSLIDHDVVNDVTLFFALSTFPRGCNTSFITLILKIQDAKLVKDFRPISLIGSVYKIIARVLAIRMSHVVSVLISDVQSAFAANRQIFDGPFILNELLS